MWNEILYIIEVILYLLFFYYIVGLNITSCKWRVIISIIIGMITFLDVFMQISNLPTTFGILIVLLFLFEERIWYKICWGIFGTFSLILLEAVEKFLFQAVYQIVSETKIEKNCIIWNEMCIVSFLCIVIFMLRKKRNFRKVLLREIKFSSYLLVTMLSIIDFFLLLSTEVFWNDGFNQYGRKIMVMLIILLIIFNIVLGVLFFALSYYNKKLKQLDLLNQNCLKMEKKYYQQLYQKNEDLRSFRHDFNEHFIVLQELAEKEEWSSLKIYLQQVKMIREHINSISTGNTIADAIINHIQEELPKDTLFKISGTFLENCFIEEIDLCTVLSNLLNNAKDAINPLEKKEIFLEVINHEKECWLIVENTSRSYTDKELEELKTTKKDFKNHGYGFINIKRVVEKYQGKIRLEYKDGYFLVTVYLRKSEKNQKN